MKYVVAVGKTDDMFDCVVPFGDFLSRTLPAVGIEQLQSMGYVYAQIFEDADNSYRIVKLDDLNQEKVLKNLISNGSDWNDLVCVDPPDFDFYSLYVNTAYDIVADDILIGQCTDRLFVISGIVKSYSISLCTSYVFWYNKDLFIVVKSLVSWGGTNFAERIFGDIYYFFDKSFNLVGVHFEDGEIFHCKHENLSKLCDNGIVAKVIMSGIKSIISDIR